MAANKPQHAEHADRRGARGLKRSADLMLDGPKDDSSSDEEDVLLFGPQPHKSARIDTDHPLQARVPNLVTLGLQAWEKEKAATGSDASTGSYSRTPAQRVPKKILEALSQNIRRLQCVEHASSDGASRSGCDDSAEAYTAKSDPERPDTVVISAKHGTAPFDLMACPYYRYDPKRSHRCGWDLEMGNTRMVRQHLIVDHRVPNHCPRCYEKFGSEVARNQHVALRTCDLRDPPAGLLVGVSEDQTQELLRCGRRMPRASRGRQNAKTKDGRANLGRSDSRVRLSEEDKWHVIWKVLFPETPCPRRAYLSAPAEREAAALRRFWRRAGPGLVADDLAGQELLRWEDTREEATLAALHGSVLAGMMDRSGLVVRMIDCTVTEGRQQNCA
ncbi:putative het and ankyrin domain protein [Phaeoacremonium minimum UCRPA7]|uniref:Putative het and ankyrin domain protein n=1 Tax=Phaeoacremonium minimum (strain UCR-PA7) TaxID=1286976 RepID=R8BVD5_PHAM7|nr:putative het and ankyrin domain protein [Phaeoacremonium minimum UCRPA7]EOO03259.1 putative het and ankyrin domain protein [Phaeoacremonium minimum UCRPA7]